MVFHLQPTGEPDHITSSAAARPSLDHFTGKVARPSLTGTVPYHSIIIDITNVLNKMKTFILDLATFCESNAHLWAVSEQIRKENGRLFAEISVSPSMYQIFLQNPTLKLENFDAPFMAYPSLSPSTNIVKLSLHKLPSQYGRQNGDEQLQNDMHFNFDQFRKLIDCGYGKHTALTHAFNWTYNPVDYSSPSGDLLQTQEQVLVFATWAVMPPYCKYCHSMNHALIECALRKKKLTCDLCHEFGHFQREYPRRNEDSSKSGKKRKVSQGSKKNVVFQLFSTSSVSIPSPSKSNIEKAAFETNAAATVRATAEIQTVIDVNAAAEVLASDAIKAQVAVDARAATVAKARSGN
ncbi:hypothetical protein HMPREF1544_03829 [Mucor circinelloides 1006PhL]|uniref:Uncharacterized protein n=1 Tax=Mucor circinelloides f. circinelloides (strain 1006PhL) TaxID=1220926 RepID=S2KAH9_MUCC1|nr:hypothetical protein HMPREF1544_03829 [Mucor circinelloides 1006PhL]